MKSIVCLFTQSTTSTAPVRPSHDERSQTVGSDRSSVAAIGSCHTILGTLAGEETLQAHESSDAITPTRAAQYVCQSRTAVGLTTAHKLLANALAQCGVL